MSDALDDLRAELQSIEPSRTFARNTLERVERERARTMKHPWLFLARLAAAAVIVFAFISWRSGGLREQPASPKPVTVSQSAEPITRPPLPVVEPTARHIRRAQRAATWTIPENAHADQAVAVRRLISLIHERRVEIPVEPTAIDDSGPAPILAPIEIKPIVITPLPNGQGGGSER